MNRIALIAALPSELRPLTRHWHHQNGLATGRIGSLDAVASCAGMGAAAVTRACERAVSSGIVDTFISIGYAGSLSCGLSAPAATSVREVIDAATGEVFPTANAKGQRLITLDHVAGVQEKRRLATEHQAVLVDMEAATVARFARRRNLDFLCFKAVTDGPNDELPDFNRFTTPDGRLRTAAFAAWAVFHPRYWRVLGELEKNSHAAAHELEKLVHGVFAGSQ